MKKPSRIVFDDVLELIMDGKHFLYPNEKDSYRDSGEVTFERDRAKLEIPHLEKFDPINLGNFYNIRLNVVWDKKPYFFEFYKCEYIDTTYRTLVVFRPKKAEDYFLPCPIIKNDIYLLHKVKVKNQRKKRFGFIKNLVKDKESSGVI
jgi:hypothetical protein